MPLCFNLRMKWIVAPNYVVAEDYRIREDLDPRDAHYVSHVNVIRGRTIDPEDVIYVGPWFERRDAVEIERALRAATKLG